MDDPGDAARELRALVDVVGEPVGIGSGVSGNVVVTAELADGRHVVAKFFADERRRHNEIRGLSSVAGTGVRVPALIAEGGSLLVVDRVPGEPCRRDGDPRPAAGALRALHERASTSGLNVFGGWDGWAQGIIGWLHWEAQKGRDRDSTRALIDPLFTWAAEQIVPAGKRPVGWIHGDFGTDNVLVDGDEAGVIDFETAALGDPLWDVACFALDFEDADGFVDAYGVSDALRGLVTAYQIVWALGVLDFHTQRGDGPGPTLPWLERTAAVLAG